MIMLYRLYEQLRRFIPKWVGRSRRKAERIRQRIYLWPGIYQIARNYTVRKLAPMIPDLDIESTASNIFRHMVLQHMEVDSAWQFPDEWRDEIKDPLFVSDSIVSPYPCRDQNGSQECRQQRVDETGR